MQVILLKHFRKLFFTTNMFQFLLLPWAGEMVKCTMFFYIRKRITGIHNPCELQAENETQLRSNY